VIGIMTIFDIIVFFVLGFFFLFSLFKGMVREVFSLLGYMTGYVLAVNYNDELAAVLQGMVTQEVMARIAGFAIIFIIVKIAVTLIIFFSVKFIFGLLGRLFRKLVDGSNVLSFPDRILGGVIGLFKGLVVIAIILFPLGLFEDSYKKITRDSVLAPYFEKMFHIVSQGSYENSFIDKIPKLSVNNIKKRVKQMSDLEQLTQEISEKKDSLLKTARELVIKETTQEEYTDEDKNELNDLLDTLSQ